MIYHAVPEWNYFIYLYNKIINYQRLLAPWDLFEDPPEMMKFTKQNGTIISKALKEPLIVNRATLKPSIDNRAPLKPLQQPTNNAKRII